MKKLVLFFTIILLQQIFYAQVSVNTTGSSAAASSMLDVSSNNKGMLIPRMTSVQRKAIVNPEMGLLVFDTDRQTVYLFDGVEWKPLMAVADNKAPLVSRSPIGAYTYSKFGASVAIHNNYAVVGAPGDSANGVFSGAVYIFAKVNGTWVQEEKIYPSDGASGDKFGMSVEIHDDHIIVGAPDKTVNNQSKRGAVYIFKRFNRYWDQLTILHASNGIADDYFGFSLAFNGQYIAVGTPYKDLPGKMNGGTVYIFGLLNNVWSQKANLTAPDVLTGIQFGYHVALHGTTLAVGSPSGITDNVITGAVYMFSRADLNGYTWIFAQKLNPSSLTTLSEFGHSVAVNSNTLLIGIPKYNNANTVPNSGAVWKYVKVNGQWQYDDGTGIYQAGLNQGNSVALDGTHEYFSMTGWQEGKGRVGLGISSYQRRYFYDDDNDINRVFGIAMDAHNGQFIISAYSMGGDGKVFFGIVD
jgi:hypothetical protein